MLTSSSRSGASVRTAVRTVVAGVARFACTWSTLALPLLGACHDPRFVERQQRRYDRIEATIGDVEKRDARRPRQIEWLFDTAERQQAQRDEHLQATLQRISDRWDKDVYYFHHGDTLQKERIERAWRGNPNRIPEVWSYLVY